MSTGTEMNPLASASAVKFPGIQPRPSVPAGFIPVSVAAADFNGDGNIDWVVANAGDNDLWIYLGRGDGTWQLPTILPVAGISPVFVVTADLRGNGRHDIIVAEADSGSVGVFLSNGDGTFATEVQYFLAESPLSLAIGDFNGDGKLDVMAGVAATGKHVFAVWPGLGNGQLGSPIYSSAASTVVLTPEVTAISVADVNKDGVLDVAIMMNGGAVAFLGKGDGSFVQSQVIASPFIFSYTAAEIGDVNEDGCPDVIVTDALAFATTYSGHCDGTFTQSAQHRLGDIGVSLALADVDGDGHLDILSGSIMDISGALGDVGGNLLSVLRGDGHGNFGEPTVYRGDPSLVGLALADLNHDGHPDVISVNEDGDSASIFLNDGKGGFGAPRGYGIGYNSGALNVPVTGLLQSDLNGDGKKDLALIELPATDPGNLQLTTLMNQGNGQFAPLVRYGVFPSTFYLPGDFVLADFRNTGHPDFVAIGLSPDISFSVPFVSFAANNGDGTFGAPSITNPPTGNEIMAVGDFNRDGKLDFVAIGGGDSGNIAALNMFLGNGDGTFQALPSVLFGGSSPRFAVSVYAGDFNRDGKLDVIVYLYYNQVPFTANDVYEFFGNGDGTFQPAIKIFSNSDPFTMLDLNRDGIPDLVTCKDPEANYPSNDQPPVISVYLGRSDGTFALTHTYQPYAGSYVDPSWRGTANAGGGFCTVADFNGDGKADIAVFQRVTGGSINRYVQFLMGNGDGSFTPTFDVFRFEKPSPPQFGLDLNGDGIADLVELDDWTSSFNYLPGAPAPPFQIGLLAEPVVDTGELQITLDVPSSSATTLTLSASDPDIILPASVTIPSGAVSQIVDFTFTASFNINHVFAITAQSGAYSATAYGSAWNRQFKTGLAVGLSVPFQSTTQGGTSPNYGLGVGTIGDYTTTATFSCKGLPAQAKCIFNPRSVFLDPNKPDGLGGGGGSAMVVSTSPSIPIGHYAFIVIASDGVVSASTPATLDISAGTPPGPDLAVSVSGSAVYAPAGYATTLVVSVSNNGQQAATTATLALSVSGPASITSASPSQGTCANSNSCDLGSLSPGSTAQVSLAVQPSSDGDVTVTATGSSIPADSSPGNDTGSHTFVATDFSLAATPSSATVKAGSSASYQLTLAPTSGSYGSTVYLSCLGAPAKAQCTVSPASVAVNALNMTATVTVSTTAPSTSSTANQLAPFYAIAFPIISIMIAMSGGQKRHGFFAILSAVLLSILVLPACGGGGATSNGGAPPTSSTPLGTYSLTIQGSSGSDIKTTVVSLVVQ